jgi:Mitochondrial carrier protein
VPSSPITIIRSSPAKISTKQRRARSIPHILPALAAAAVLILPLPSLATSSIARQQQRCEARMVLVSSAGSGGATASFKVAACAALVASAAATLVCHPIDTLKTLKQAESMNLTRASGAVVGDGGLGGRLSLRLLYRGVASNILKEAPNAAIYLGLYEVFRAWLVGSLGGLFATQPLLTCCLAGMMGDAVGSVVRVPAEILNKRLQLGLSVGWGNAFRDAFLSPMGLQSTLASWTALLWRDVPYGGLQIALYEFARTSLRDSLGPGIPSDMLSGAIAGSVAAVLTTPADVLVTRMSAQNPQSYLETRRFMSPWATAVRIIRHEGLQGLTSGAAQRGLYYAPLIAVFFLCYEAAKAALLTPHAAAAVLASLGWVAWCGGRLLTRNASVRFALYLSARALRDRARRKMLRKQESSV